MREMKNSGIEWAPCIPESWYSKKAKYNFVNTKYIPGIRSVEYDRLALTMKGVIHRSKDDADGLQPKDFLTYQLLRKGELVFKLIDLQNVTTSRVGLAHDTGLVSPAYIILKATGEVLPEFAEKYFLMLWHREIFNALGDNGVRSNLNATDLLNVPICYPSIAEQQAIVAFLDSKCAEIDALSADIQSEIDTLESNKRSTIFEVIEHGLDHSNFTQTDSQVWTTIPTGWKLVDIKYLFEIVKCIAGIEGYDVLAITQKGLKVKDISINEGQIASDYSGYQFVYPGDYAMNHMDLLTGWVDLSDKFGVTSPDYRVFRLRNTTQYDRKYYLYVMQCCYQNRIFYSLGQGVSNLGRWRLQTSAFNDFKVPVPPFEEQARIGEYLDRLIGEINYIITQKQEQLSVLANYKKSIIYEYVTGKKEVAKHEN